MLLALVAREGSSTGPTWTPEIHIVGQATFSDGTPYVNATARLFVRDCDVWPCQAQELGIDKTDANGRYEIRYPGAVERLPLLVEVATLRVGKDTIAFFPVGYFGGTVGVEGVPASVAVGYTSTTVVDFQSELPAPE